MVERPIKKSERLAKEPAEVNPDGEMSPTPRQSKPVLGSNRGRDKDKDRDKGDRRGKGKGRNNSKDDAPRPPANLALMRGPKPVKQEPVVEESAVEEQPSDVESDAVTEPDTVAEGDSDGSAND